jgi:hypothetical protein
MTLYRIYADGTIVHQDDFHEWDHSQPYYDDFTCYSIADALEKHLYQLGYDDGVYMWTRRIKGEGQDES